MAEKMMCINSLSYFDDKAKRKALKKGKEYEIYNATEAAIVFKGEDDKRVFLLRKQVKKHFITTEQADSLERVESSINNIAIMVTAMQEIRELRKQEERTRSDLKEELIMESFEHRLAPELIRLLADVRRELLSGL